MSPFTLTSHAIDERGIAGAFLRDDGARFRAAIKGAHVVVLREVLDAHSGEAVVVHIAPGSETYNTLSGLMRRLVADLSAAPEA